MEFLAAPDNALAALFVASFLAATLLPGGSEAALLALLWAHPEQTWPALALASLGNTLGGMSTWALAQLAPQRLPPRHVALVQKRGPPLLLLAWTPLLGDLLCAAAGWLRLPWLPCLLWMALGKTARYAVLIIAASPTMAG